MHMKSLFVLYQQKEKEGGLGMKKKTREIVAFILNLWPGLGFYFSGTVHNLKWLRLLGVGLIVAFLLIITIGIAIVIPHPLRNYHFTASDLLFPLAIAFIFGIFGAGVEHELG